MIKSVIPASALLLCSAFAFAAGGGAGGGGGAAGAAGGGHPSGAAHRGSSFGNPALENNAFPGVRARSGCVGAVAGIPNAGGPWPEAPPSKTNPSSTNGLAVEGNVQSSPDLPRLSPQDERILAAIKQANEKLGTSVRGTTNGQTKNRQPSQPAHVIGTNEGIRRKKSDPARPLASPELGDSSAVKETADSRSVEGKPDVSHMSEESQRLAREIIRETDKLGKIGNPGSGDGRSQAQQAGPGTDPRSHTNGPHPPTSSMGASSGSC
jgi:hypothetical protein